MATQKWIADTDHSEIKFRVKHMMITNVTGRFNDFKIEAYSEGEDFSDGTVTFVAKTESIDTDNDKRDEHMRSSDFFEVSKYPEIRFKSTKYEKKDKNSFKLTGDLTIKDKTNSVTLDGELGGIAKDPWGNEKAGFSLEGKINRKDWGLNWNASLEAGGVLVSDEVKISCEVQLVHAD